MQLAGMVCNNDEWSHINFQNPLSRSDEERSEKRSEKTIVLSEFKANLEVKYIWGST